MSKQYIGDGVYVDVENGMIKLTTENGIEENNTIYLEPEVLASFLNYVETLRVGVVTVNVKPQNVITTHDGLLFRDGDQLDTMEADKAARENGFVYAEQLVAFLASKHEPVVTPQHDTFQRPPESACVPFETLIKKDKDGL